VGLISAGGVPLLDAARAVAVGEALLGSAPALVLPMRTLGLSASRAVAKRRHAS